MNNEFLPIGSIVILNGGAKKLMINGYGGISSDTPNKIYDYTGVLYPEGQLKYDNVYLFNKSDIAKVYFKGYVDDEGKAYINNFEKIIHGDQNVGN